jgi:hypothetical protein
MALNVLSKPTFHACFVFDGARGLAMKGWRPPDSPRRPHMAAQKRYFEFSDGTSNKFWEVWVEGHQVFTRYGKIGARAR